MIDFHDLTKFTPFLLTAGQVKDINVTRLLEAFIIAVVTATLTMFGTVQVLTVKLERIERDVAKVQAQADVATEVQLKIVPMRNLQVQTLQENVKELYGRVSKLEDRARK